MLLAQGPQNPKATTGYTSTRMLLKWQSQHFILTISLSPYL